MASGHSIIDTGESTVVQARGEDPTLADLAARLWAGKIWIIAGTIVGLIAGMAYLDRTTFLYTASMKVTAAPSSQSSTPRAGGLGGLAALAGVSLGAGAGGASPFDIYLETLTSENVAARLANDPQIMRKVFASDWDSERRQWREPEAGLKARLGVSIKKALGLPVATWSEPDERRLAGFLGSQIGIQRDTKSPVVGISLDHSDPQFAKALLAAVSRETDRLIRQTALARSRSYADYLERKLPTVTVVEQRDALVQTLSEQERSIMMASSAVPFAATIISGPVVSALPTKPNAQMALIAFTTVGLMFGGLIALINWGRLRALLRSGVHAG